MCRARLSIKAIARPLAALAGAFALVACQGGEAHQPPAKQSVIGLSSSLPIVWPETEGISELLSQDASEHWALATLRQQGEVRVLDSLIADDGTLPLPEDALLVMVQPWPLSPQENVALDEWVRGGGRVLLMADPMLTFESAYALGDRRRPQDIALLSPILSRWGLQLLPVEEGAPLSDVVEIDGTPVPVALPGRFKLLEKSTCAIFAGGLLAECRIGGGRAVAFADAALLESREDDGDESRSAALKALLVRAAN